MKFLKIVGFPIVYGWREMEKDSATGKPFPLPLRIFGTVAVAGISYFLLAAMIRGIIAFF